MAEVVLDLLDRDEIEPAQDLRDDAVVLVPTLLRAEVGDVPCGQKEAVSDLVGNPTSGLLLAQRGDLHGGIV